MKVRGLEFHHAFAKFKEIHAIFGDSIVYVPYLSGECRGYANYPALAATLLKQGCAQTRFWFAVANGWADEAVLRRRIEGRR